MFNTKQLIKGNKAIAVFDGYEYKEDTWLNGNKGVLTKAGKPSLYGDLVDEDFCPRYHSSWDWLMPVVSKVNKVLAPLDHPLIVTRAGIFLNKIHNALSDVSIKSAYKEIVEAIEFYNSNIAVKSD